VINWSDQHCVVQQGSSIASRCAQHPCWLGSQHRHTYGICVIPLSAAFVVQGHKSAWEKRRLEDIMAGVLSALHMHPLWPFVGFVECICKSCAVHSCCAARCTCRLLGPRKPWPQLLYAQTDALHLPLESCEDPQSLMLSSMLQDTVDRYLARGMPCVQHVLSLGLSRASITLGPTHHLTHFTHH
jgi:hypothetical protein